MEESPEVLLPPGDEFLGLLLFLRWQWWDYDIWVILAEDFAQIIKVLILPMDGPVERLGLDFVNEITRGENTSGFEGALKHLDFDSFVV